mmetsp:Transcript_1794/g.5216  ORF Transcript_1794/g.5216 Transcript_1794/m.5216 type:complete len:128 (+) Transcript_1794:3-386(+)
MQVEYASPLEGARGSYYSGVAMHVDGKVASFRHDELRAEDGAQAQAAVQLKHLRPLPPPPPEGFLSSVKRGARLELRYLDGWWDVVLRKRLGGGKLRVEAVGYGAVHDVEPAQLRPAWKWTKGTWRW